MDYLKKISSHLGFVLIVMLCNLHLLLGTDPAVLIFDPIRVADGQWWRLVTHPFVHVSWYHLLLDSVAIIMLWRELRLSSYLHKTLAAMCCAGGSLLFALFVSDQVAEHGLCGFSGTAHGLAFLLGLSWAAEARGRRGNGRQLLAATGLILAFASVAKSLHEFLSGSVFLSQMHTGELGIPIVASHLGGVLGGMAAALLLLPWRKKPFGPAAKVPDNSCRTSGNSRQTHAKSKVNSILRCKRPGYPSSGS